MPSGTAVVVTLDQGVSSKDAKIGQRLDGSVTNSVVLEGKAVIPQRSRVRLSVAEVQASSRPNMPAKLWLKIDSIEVNGQNYPASTRWSGQTGENHNKRNVVALGSGEGVLISAAAEPNAGAGATAFGARKDITFPAKTQLRFIMTRELTIR
jgi:hypothetical protein